MKLSYSPLKLEPLKIDWLVNDGESYDKPSRESMEKLQKFMWELGPCPYEQGISGAIISHNSSSILVKKAIDDLMLKKPLYSNRLLSKNLAIIALGKHVIKPTCIPEVSLLEKCLFSFINNNFCRPYMRQNETKCKKRQNVTNKVLFHTRRGAHDICYFCVPRVTVYAFNVKFTSY